MSSLFRRAPPQRPVPRSPWTLIRRHPSAGNWRYLPEWTCRELHPVADSIVDRHSAVSGLHVLHPIFQRAAVFDRSEPAALSAVAHGEGFGLHRCLPSAVFTWTAVG